MSTTVLVIALLAVTAAVVVILLLANAARGRGASSDIPPALRPGYSDEQLERRVLERYMAWGVVLTAFFAVFLPVYWLREPARLNGSTDAAFVDSVERGEALFVENCALCHGQNAEGGGAASTYDPADSWPAPNLTTIVKRYEGTPVTDVQEYIETTLHKGRPGTPMPAWGVEYGGPMTDQQITDITSWILVNQKAEVDEATSAADMSGEQLYQTNCVRCHGRDLEGFIGPTLIGLFERHDSEETILGILRNGVYLANGISMPPWQTGYMYPDARYTDAALNRIVDYLRAEQPATIPQELRGTYVTPYPGFAPPEPTPGDEASESTGGSPDT